MARGKKVSIEIACLNNDEQWVTRYKLGGVTLEARRSDSLRNAIENASDRIVDQLYVDGFKQKDVEIKIIL